MSGICTTAPEFKSVGSPSVACSDAWLALSDRDVDGMALLAANQHQQLSLGPAAAGRSGPRFKMPLSRSKPPPAREMSLSTLPSIGTRSSGMVGQVGVQQQALPQRSERHAGFDRHGDLVAAPGLGRFDLGGRQRFDGDVEKRAVSGSVSSNDLIAKSASR